jgi:uncharacterized membrane protein YjjB (DUF3815 family)
MTIYQLRQVITGPWYVMLVTGIITMIASLILFNAMQGIVKEEDKGWIDFLIWTIMISGGLYFTLLVGWCTGCFEKYRYTSV